MLRPVITVALMTSLLFALGCSRKIPAANQDQPMPMVQSSNMPAGMPLDPSDAPMSMPMMKEDPRSIKSIEGEIQELDKSQIVVFTKKKVSLKFQMDEKTDIRPEGRKLQPGMNVKVEIDHLRRGMRAKEIDIQS